LVSLERRASAERVAFAGESARSREETHLFGEERTGRRLPFRRKRRSMAQPAPSLVAEARWSLRRAV
jgi:hypothetical protein